MLSIGTVMSTIPNGAWCSDGTYFTNGSYLIDNNFLFMSKGMYVCVS